ncbi:methylmalonyl-CoA epimerase [Nonlabens marinus S1-08]|uniref:Methylmalonyl-CoA epimerase n=2 Tax=Nonlabens TaxID=363408 RepID=W8VPW0_9FLAO|nr:methylmalonyl-CoA epimerase [Nonlabens marinus S1-08]
MDSQDLKKYQWQNRIVLVLSDDETNKNFKTQIESLKAASAGCAELKLVLYQVLPNQVTLHHFEAADKKPSPNSSDLYKEFMRSKDSFKFVLIGLDGSIKKEQSTIMETEELFSIIDGMSIRQAEMKRKNES